jgi:hypothetical protein
MRQATPSRIDLIGPLNGHRCVSRRGVERVSTASGERPRRPPQRGAHRRKARRRKRITPKWAGDTHTYRTTAAAASDSTVLGGGHAIYRARLRQSTSPTCSSAERTSRPSRPRTRCSSSTSAPPKSPSAARSTLPLPRARGEHRGDARQSAAMPSPLIGEPPMHRPVTYCPVRTRRASAGASGRIVKYIADFRRKKRELRVSVWPGWFIPILYLWNSSLYRLF